MPFRNEEHKAAFETAVKKTDKNNHRLMSALYLLTANLKLWEIMKQHTEKNGILFDNVKLGTISEKAYTLYCTAKDLYLGTKNLSVCDLADENLLSAKTFALICDAMAVQRIGLTALKSSERKQDT